ncbi:putative tRNA pseudouridine synthase B [uncultured archaeon]|nr:putative tRNA pseudouridine synthase B [uncultured archaeon]
MSSSNQTLSELLSCSFVVIDKPRGPSSHEVSAWVRKILGTEKSGHCGTLDPQVSGVLPVGVGKATKLLPYLTSKDKKYVCLMRTGREVSEQEILGLFKRFTGEITQTPPKMSAVAKVKRKRKVYYIKPIQIKPKDVLFEVHCEAGTYIRVLVSDFGRFVGGAEMLELRRIAVGVIPESSCHTLQALSDAYWLATEKHDEAEIRKMLVPPQEALGLPSMTVRDSAVETVCAGSPLYAPGLVGADAGIKKGGNVMLLTEKGEFIGVGKAEMPSEEIAVKKAGAVALPERIIMKRGTYPK